MQHRHGVYCLIYELKSFLLPASRMEWWISPLVEDRWVLHLVEEEKCGRITLPKGPGECWECSQATCCTPRWEMRPFHPLPGGCLGGWLWVARNHPAEQRDLVLARKIRYAEKHHRLPTFPWQNGPRKHGCGFDSAFLSHHPLQDAKCRFAFLSCCDTCVCWSLEVSLLTSWTLFQDLLTFTISAWAGQIIHEYMLTFLNQFALASATTPV